MVFPGSQFTCKELIEDTIMANTYDLPTEGCQSAILAPDVPCATHNICVQAIDMMIYRTVQELTKSVSGRVTGLTQKDMDRIDTYYNRIIEYVDLVSQDMVDYKYLIQLKLTDIQVYAIQVENEAVNAAVQYLLASDIQIRICQSTRLNDGLLEPDKEDLLEGINKSKSVIDLYFGSNNPLDMPQSTPSKEVVLPTSE